jgi:uncharacterized protein (DUF1684 family)
MAAPTGDLLALADWKRRVSELYRQMREEPDPAAAWRRWRDTRDVLFARHPQSPLPPGARAAFSGLAYFEHDPELRVLADVVPAPAETIDIGSSGEAPIRFTRFASAEFALAGDAHALDLFWLEGYGGGLYLPFADATSGDETYGAGRYLLDSVKGADLGMEGDRLVLDFNLAYNPSCAYDPRWVCPLAPPANRLPVPVRGGELVP